MSRLGNSLRKRGMYGANRRRFVMNFKLPLMSEAPCFETSSSAYTLYRSIPSHSNLFIHIQMRASRRQQTQRMRFGAVCYLKTGALLDV